jgi:hypothetical protein
MNGINQSPGKMIVEWFEAKYNIATNDEIMKRKTMM